MSGARTSPYHVGRDSCGRCRVTKAFLARANCHNARRCRRSPSILHTRATHHIRAYRCRGRPMYRCRDSYSSHHPIRVATLPHHRPRGALSQMSGASPRKVWRRGLPKTMDSRVGQCNTIAATARDNKERRTTSFPIRADVR